jgi:putative peptidoglycan lipid II flippase
MSTPGRFAPQVSGSLGSSRMALMLSMINLAIGVVSFLNQLIIAKTFGTGSEMDAFASVMALPALISGLIPTLMTGVLVPSLAHHAPEDRHRLGCALFWLLLGLALLVGVGGILISPYWAQWFIQRRPDLASLRVPILDTASLLWASVSVNILVSFLLAIRLLQKRFVLATILPALNLLLTITLVSIFATEWSIRTLGLAQFASALIQCAVLLPDWWRTHGSPRRDLAQPELRAILTRFPPMALSQLPYTAAPLVGMFWSVSLGAGAQSYLSYSYSLTGFCAVMIGMGVSTVALPHMAEGIRDGARHDILHETATRFHVVFLAAVWLSALVFGVREPMLRLLLQRGAFDAHSVQGTAELIPFFLVGMIAFASMNLIRNIYYAMQSYWRTAAIGIAIPLLYFGLAGILAGPLGMAGIGIAFALAYTAFLAISLYWIPGTITGLWSATLVRFVLRTVIAGLFAGWLTAQLSVLLRPLPWLPVALLGCAGAGSSAFWLIAFGGLPADIRARFRLVLKATTHPGS